MTDTDIAQAGTGPLHIGTEVANCQTTEPADPHASHFVNGPDEPLSTTAEVCFLDWLEVFMMLLGCGFSSMLRYSHKSREWTASSVRRRRGGTLK